MKYFPYLLWGGRRTAKQWVAWTGWVDTIPPIPDPKVILGYYAWDGKTMSWHLDRGAL